MRTLGAPIEVVDGVLGDAMGHKLLRSVFMKSLAAAVTEAVTAGRAAGHEEWIRSQIARELSGDGQRTIDRFLRGTVLHAARRSEEMEAATRYLEQLGVTPTMSQAAATLHRDAQHTEVPEATTAP
jgi:3-hydroxyisobutyrate dehydrogenase-like beta-hydroxyacid dehydrogenase